MSVKISNFDKMAETGGKAYSQTSVTNKNAVKAGKSSAKKKPSKKQTSRPSSSSSSKPKVDENSPYANEMNQAVLNMKVSPQVFPEHVDTISGDIAKYGMREQMSGGYLQVTLATVSGTYPLVPRSAPHDIPSDSQDRLFKDLISVQLQNDISNDIPTLTFVLGNSKDWSSLIAVNDLVRLDYISPRADDKVSSRDICLYTGLVSNLSRSVSYASNQDNYTIVAQGMAKIFSNIQLSTFSELQTNLSSYALLPDDEKTGIAFTGHTSANIVKQIINRFILQNLGGSNTYDFLANQNGNDITKRATVVTLGEVTDLMNAPMSEADYEQYMEQLTDSDSSEDTSDIKGNNGVSQTASADKWLNTPMSVNDNGELPLQNLIEFYIYENLDESYPNAGQNNPFINYNGSILQFIKDVSCKPFNEMYWTHNRGVATFNYRPTPYDPENWKALPITEIDPSLITGINLSNSDSDQASIFKLTATQGLGSTNFTDTYSGTFAPLTNLELIHRYGYKLMEATVDYFNGSDTENSDAQSKAGTANSDSEAMKGYTENTAQLHRPPYSSIVDAFYYVSGGKHASSEITIPTLAGGEVTYNAVDSALKNTNNPVTFANSVARYGINQSQANQLWTERNAFNRIKYLSVMAPSYNPTSQTLSKSSKYLRSYKTMAKHPNESASELISELQYSIGSKQAYDLVQCAIKNHGAPTESEFNSIMQNDKFTDVADGVDGSPGSGSDSVPFFFLRYTQKLFDWYADSAKFYTGSITLRDIPTDTAYIGERVEFYDSSSKAWWECYCEGMSVSYDYVNGMQVTLNLTRGVPLETEVDSFDKRFKSPWSFWGQYANFQGGYFGEQNLATGFANGGSSDSSSSGKSNNDIIKYAQKIMNECNWSYSQPMRTDMGTPNHPKKNGHADCSSFGWFVLKSCGYDVGDSPFTTFSAPKYLEPISEGDSKAGDIVIANQNPHFAFLEEKWKGGDTRIINMGGEGDNVNEDSFDRAFGQNDHNLYRAKK